MTGRVAKLKLTAFGEYPPVPDELTFDMTRNDIVDVLRHLKFAKHGGGSKQIWLDRDVRDYLVNALSR
jgi:hypothetical protein